MLSQLFASLSKRIRPKSLKPSTSFSPKQKAEGKKNGKVAEKNEAFHAIQGAEFLSSIRVFCLDAHGVAGKTSYFYIVEHSKLWKQRWKKSEMGRADREDQEVEGPAFEQRRGKQSKFRCR